MEDNVDKSNQCNLAHPSSDDLGLLRSDQIHEERKKFDTEITALLERDSSSGRSLFAFVRRTLKAFHLERSYTAAYLLNEAYIRGCNRIVAGEQIRNPPAWVRQATYNVVRELSREQRKENPLDDSLLENRPNSVTPELLEDDLETLRMALQMLDPFDAKLLHLKIGEELSWKEVRLRLISEGDGDYSEELLRKRKERALRRMRKKYHAINPASEIPKP